MLRQSLNLRTVFNTKNIVRLHSTTTSKPLASDDHSAAANIDAVEHASKDLFSDPISEFKVFPKIEDISPSELVGGTKFGKKNYLVERSSTGNLPVYTEYKSMKCYTEIRKIRGNPIQLRDDLQERLPHIPKKQFKVILQSNKILIEGNYATDIKSVLSTTF
ncbi:related to 54S ribosomal protein IMG2, mitochondrial [Saccharomycodes ludwigii]|uniref:Large ribosomal subunit protein mL49 n=1 Tax=Saccharomycodes ludwigii TaxID=36035 RepID=A0A376B2C5_9ASCO|nr:related to 54S ribosomal protein IMG2, mitochondrial [Saccharomycodes ludwigii]